jgi:hypothetical protein
MTDRPNRPTVAPASSAHISFTPNDGRAVLRTKRLLTLEEVRNIIDAEDLEEINDDHRILYELAMCTTRAF